MKRKIYAVHDRDLESFLTDLGLLESVQRKEITCPECGCEVTLENIGFISMLKGDIRICCDDIDCFYKKRRKFRGVEEE